MLTRTKLSHCVVLLFICMGVLMLSSCGSEVSESTVETQAAPKAAAPEAAAVATQKVAESKPVAAEKAADVEGKWYGYWKSDWGQEAELMVTIAGVGGNRFQITVYESSEDYAPEMLEISCTLIDGNTLVFDSTEVIEEGKGVVVGESFSGKFVGTESGTFELHAVNKKDSVNLVGKWQGYWANEWGDQVSLAIQVTETADGHYRFDMLDYAETVQFSLDGRLEDSGKISFSGENETWTGTGRGFCSGQTWSGTFEGDEYGRYTLTRVEGK